MNTADIRSLLDKLEELDESGVQVAQVGQALADMAMSLSAVAQAQERPPAWVAELVAAIRSVKFEAPQVSAPVINLPAPIINVQPAEVMLPPQPLPAAQMPIMSSGVRMRVTKRDDLGRLSELIFIPEN